MFIVAPGFSKYNLPPLSPPSCVSFSSSSGVSGETGLKGEVGHTGKMGPIGDKGTQHVFYVETVPSLVSTCLSLTLSL